MVDCKLKKQKMEGLVLKNVEMTLGELIVQKELILKLYNGVTEFSRMLEIEEKVIEPLDKIFRVYDKKINQLKENREKEGDVVINKEYQRLLSEKINIVIGCVKRKDIVTSGYNVYEYRIIKKYVLD